jgi:uncharacterized DUF497 family protein
MFEWDEAKNQLNQLKHKINFSEAIALWDDTDGIEIQLPFVSEERILRIASLYSIVWSAIFTIRGTNIRLISVRRSRDNERVFYEKQKNISKRIR